MVKRWGIGASISILLASMAALAQVTASPVPTIPAISTLLKANIYKRMTQDREVMVYARLEDQKGSDLKRYSFYAAMLVNRNLEAVRAAFLDYGLYPKMIPYVDRADYRPSNHLLDVDGGIWKFRLHSQALMDERGDRWIHYRIVGGHFTGLSGDMFLEPYTDSRGSLGTLVYFRGERSGPASEWPPTFVIERGAEIVFGYTGTRMRSYIESQKQPQKPSGGGLKNDTEVPQPRSHL